MKSLFNYLKIDWMKRNIKLVFIISGTILLFPLLFFPLGNDSIVFMNIARKLLAGHTLYVDAIDLKPPLIYFLYIPVYLISSGSEFIVRIIDFLYQMVILGSAFYVIKKSTGDEKIAFINIILYSLLYTSLGANFTFQSDTHINLVIIWMIHIVLNKSPKSGWNFLLGAMTGVMFFFKYNLAILIIPSAFLFWYFQPGQRMASGLIITGLIQAAGMLVFIASVSLVFLQQGVWEGFTDVFDYSLFYSSMPALNTELFKYIIKEGSAIIADNFSLLYLTFVVIAFARLFRNDEGNAGKNRFMQTLAVFGVILLVTVFIERKLHIYHFTRFLIIAAIFASFGAGEMYALIKAGFSRMNLPLKFIAVSAVAFLIVYSPLSRWVFNIRMPYFYMTNTTKYDNLFERPGESANTRVQMKSAAEFIKSNARTEDTVITISTGANLINLLLGDYRTSAFEQSCFYLGTHKIHRWQDKFRSEMQNAKWLIIQNNDRHLWINGHNMPSCEALAKDTVFGKLMKNFDTVYNTENFFVTKRIY